MKTYHNHKPFKCPHCIKDFKKKRQLKCHLKDAHPDKPTTIPAADARDIVR